MESDKFTPVSEIEFHQYIKDKPYLTEQGEFMHSQYYIINDEKIGWSLSSSWGAKTIYKLKYPN